MKTFKLVIAGDRNFKDYRLLKNKVSRLLSEKKSEFEIIIVSGVARGAGMLGEQYAAEYGYEVAEFPADWSKGNSTGYACNKEMADFADACICFWDGLSKGTKHMIDLAIAKGLPLSVINY